tara:strand:- start:1053 stop:1235 length:183 start_codon:yes stop_codon:yes gene_type:complete
MTSNIELRQQIKLLRAQLHNLEVKCQDREDKVVKILMKLEPFVEVLTATQQKQLMDAIDT